MLGHSVRRPEPPLESQPLASGGSGTVQDPAYPKIIAELKLALQIQIYSSFSLFTEVQFLHVISPLSY